MPEHVSYATLLDAVRARRPRIAFIFGSGLGNLDERMRPLGSVPFLDVPGLCGTTVPGHKGSLRLGEWAGVPVLVFSGRLHYYEGHPWRRVTQPVHLAGDLGIDTLVVTNAAGGIREDLVPGTLMVLTAHLECTTPEWWRELSSRNKPNPYDASLRARLQAAGQRLDIVLAEGVYAQVTGPSYETRAEIRALRHCGADAVGMSTAQEVRVAHDLGMRCAAISCITNRAAGLSHGPIHHGEVLGIAAQLRERLARLLEAFLASGAV
ncbi:MAG: purine-nucleoside phosphorylase [Gemmataceae bacterium]|nr:purine-nucleoside phosphorylase [Gemmataceae bacterium]